MLSSSQRHTIDGYLFVNAVEFLWWAQVTNTADDVPDYVNGRYRDRLGDTHRFIAGSTERTAAYVEYRDDVYAASLGCLDANL